jgi:hypothetical protein
MRIPAPVPGWRAFLAGNASTLIALSSMLIAGLAQTMRLVYGLVRMAHYHEVSLLCWEPRWMN